MLPKDCRCRTIAASDDNIIAAVSGNICHAAAFFALAACEKFVWLAHNLPRSTLGAGEFLKNLAAIRDEPFGGSGAIFDRVILVCHFQISFVFLSMESLKSA